MKRLLALVLTSTMNLPCGAAVGLAAGVHEWPVNAFDRKDVVVATRIAVPANEHCRGWRWGAERACPATALVDLVVRVGTRELFTPQSAFADLGNPVRIELKPASSLLQVVITGGEAASSYTAVLSFSPDGLMRRKVYGKATRHDAWEETKYSFAK